MKRKSQQGIALVLTLIFLSVITFMAVTFLVVSQREGEQVNTTVQQATAKMAADGIAQQAIGQIAGRMLGRLNGYDFGLVVSANYLSLGYDNTGNAGQLAALTNVSYNYTNGAPLNAADQLQMLNNLLYLPRVPVFISTNKNFAPEFRFYHDLNRNGVYDPSGVVINLDDNGLPIPDAINPTTSVQVGDPEWIGFLEHPEQRHSSSNLFLARGAFLAVPIGNTLDINYIHNQAKSINANSDGFLRNEGVGSWEINLAAFLHTLNTNWDNDVNPFSPQYTPLPYAYTTNLAIPSVGTSFNDAAAILQYRYSNDFHNLSSFASLYPPNNPVFPSLLFGSDHMDGYAVGPLMTNLFLPPFENDSNVTANPWSGADNPRRFYGSQDLFTAIPALLPANPLDSFTNRLSLAGKANSTYNRYTFYRMLAQMGFDSAPEPSPFPGTRKINLNYVNIGGTNATNFIPWTPAQFFTNAADRLLRAQPELAALGINITNIQIYPTNLYTPSVHRLLQLAANIYDASTNKTGAALTDNFDYPSVFRPNFVKTIIGTNTVVCINGYSEVTLNDPNYLNVPLDLRRTLDMGNLAAFDTNNNVYGAPYVIGARQGLPNFNKFSISPAVQLSRKLQITRPSTNSPLSAYHTNIQYVIGISNSIGVECWNSYNTAYGRNIRVLVSDDFTIQITNDFGFTLAPLSQTINQTLSPITSFLSNTIPGSTSLGNATPSVSPLSFILPLMTNMPTLAYVQVGGSPTTAIFTTNIITSNPISFSAGYLIPHWGLYLTNRVRVIIQDMPNGLTGAPGRIIDYVLLNGLDQFDDINSDMTNLIVRATSISGAANISLWNPAAYSSNGAPSGIYYQVGIAKGDYAVNGNVWSSSFGGGTVQNGIQGMSNWFSFKDPSQQKQVPYVAYANYCKTFMWSANDPLVHYHPLDLLDPTQTNAITDLTITNRPVIDMLGFQKLSPRYHPWQVNSGLSPLNKIGAPGGEAELAFKDPLIRQSADWQFPTNKYPNIGWLGRVHRGTPWQTVYMKSTGITDLNVWANWSGNVLSNYFGGLNDTRLSQPINDWRIFDLFTTAPNDNASRGQLSVNQPNLAAWAAVLDGVIVISNSTTAGYVPMIINPNDTNNVPGFDTNTVQFIVSSINATRTAVTGQSFTNMGQVLSTPQLTVASPYINPNSTANLTDAVYERIPQQIMSLLRQGSARYVIFAYGQSLKPAPRSILQSGPFFGMCTNYQITGEVLTRTVVRFDNSGITPSNQTHPQAVIESFNILGPD